MAAASEDSAEAPAETSGLSAAKTAKLYYATKTALSLTLAYLIPMAMGWPQPQTAAITVMLIAAAGAVSESLQKGVMRVIGTVAGAVIGLSLVALFPQDRMTYLLAVSLVVAAIVYLYNAYQADGTVFMLTAVVTMMVFNGGDAEGAFLYGVDRAFMTAFGVLVYTVVASMLWPVKSADNTREMAAGLTGVYGAAFDRLARESDHDSQQVDAAEEAIQAQLASLVVQAQDFHSHFVTVKGSANGVADYAPEWSTVVATFEELQETLVPALRQLGLQADTDYSRFIPNYGHALVRTGELFAHAEATWSGDAPDEAPTALTLELDREALAAASHLDVAMAVARAELLTDVQAVLVDLQAALDSLLGDKGGFRATREAVGKPAFIWLDLENFRTSVRVFITFWVAAALWITVNPPGGFQFVVMSALLMVLASYTPVSPKLLIILLTLGFAIALPAYVFVLPYMIHWVQLALFLWAYAFIGFFVFAGPVSIFFMLGLFTLGLQNQMNYNVDVLLLIVLMFYMVCATLIITLNVPFSSRPERLYASLRRRFFAHCAAELRYQRRDSWGSAILHRLRRGARAAIMQKMEFWGTKIDATYFAGNDAEKITVLNQACEILHAQVQIATRRRAEFRANPLVREALARNTQDLAANLCDALAEQDGQAPFAEARQRLGDIEARLTDFLKSADAGRYTDHEVALFYVYLGLQASILGSIGACREAQQAIDWAHYRETRF